MSLLGIDLGTTGCKGVCFDEDGNIKASAYREHTLLYPSEDFVETDPNFIWESVKLIIREITSRTADDPVKAIAFSSMGESFTPVNRKLEFLHNSIMAFDSRAKEESDYLEERAGKPRIFEITGQPMNPIYPLPKIMWLRKHKPEVFENTWKFLCYQDLAGALLGADPAIDYSLVARTLAFDIRSKAFSDEMLEHAKLDSDEFARPVPSGEVIGKVSSIIASEVGLNPDTAIVAGGFDQPCAALGAGINMPGIADDGIGTVECVTAVFERIDEMIKLLRSNIPYFPHVIEGLYCAIGYNFTGGALLRWYRDNFGSDEVEISKKDNVNEYDIIIASASKDISSVLILPHFIGTGTPWLDTASKGAILGLTLGTTKGDIIRAILESETYEIKVNIDAMESAGITINELRAIGGGARSDTWMQIKSDITNKKIVTLNVTEGGCLAAALLAGTAIGVYKDINEAISNVIKINKEFYPDEKQHKRYLLKFEVYKKIYPAIKEISHRM
ncbi:MAG: FGGY family carbohydrate kinase [Actinobacteria bacterium]|nr:FGGY family carbohydrate kinase [Actinomycetota bacterium]